MTPVLRRAALVLLCSALMGCAAGDDGPPDRGPRPDGGSAEGHGPQRRLPNVFISLTGEPFRAPPGAPYPVATWFARADADHDGRLTRAEVHADALGFFDRLDENHDGVIDGLELQDYEQTVAPEILPQIEGLHAEEGMDPNLTFGDPNNTDNRPRESGRRGEARQPDPARGVGTQGAAVYSLVNTPEPVAAADAALDGRISRAEFLNAVDARFTGLDTTAAGYLTLAGLPKTPIQKLIIQRATADRKAKRSQRSSP